MTTFANPKTNIPRSAGIRRPVARIRPGWWVHLEAAGAAPCDVPDGWEQVDSIAESCDVYALWFACGKTIGGVSGRAEAVTLTEKDATELGLIAEVTP